MIQLSTPLSTPRSISIEEGIATLFGQPQMVRPMYMRYYSSALDKRFIAGQQALMVATPQVINSIVSGEGSQKPYQMTGDGIAVIEVSGATVNRYGWMEGCGFTSYEYLHYQLEFARRDDDTKSIILRVDSPGGECAGAFDLADLIFRIRGEKAIYGVANDKAYSAGLLLLAQCSKVFVTQSSGTGSVGVIAHMLDATGLDEKIGLKYTVVFAGARKADGNSHIKTDPAAVAQLQGAVDDFYGMFVSSVARGRGMTEEAVRKTEARCYTGAQAIEIGFADQVANIYEVVAMLTAAKRSPGAKAPGRMIEGALPTVAAAGEPGSVKDEPAPVPGVEPMPEDDEDDEETPAVEAEIPIKEDKMEQPIVAPAANQQEQPTPAPVPVAAAAPVAAPMASDEFESKINAVKLAGVKMKPEYAGMSLADVRADIFKTMAEADESAPVRSAIKPAPAAANSLGSIEAAAQAEAEKGGITFEQAYTKALRANPAAYAAWDEANRQTVQN